MLSFMVFSLVDGSFPVLHSRKTVTVWLFGQLTVWLFDNSHLLICYSQHFVATRTMVLSWYPFPFCFPLLCGSEAIQKWQIQHCWQCIVFDSHCFLFLPVCGGCRRCGQHTTIPDSCAADSPGPTGLYNILCVLSLCIHTTIHTSR